MRTEAVKIQPCGKSEKCTHFYTNSAAASKQLQLPKRLLKNGQGDTVTGGAMDDA